MASMPHFICPNCGDRSISSERTDFRTEALGCSKCGYGFLFELLDDYYPSPNAAFVVCDQESRVISCGRGVRELTGLGDTDTIGRPVRDVLGLEFQNGDDHIGTALEWGYGCSRSRWWCTRRATARSRQRPTYSRRMTRTGASCS